MGVDIRTLHWYTLDYIRGFMKRFFFQEVNTSRLVIMVGKTISILFIN